MRSYLQLSKLGPRYITLQRHGSFATSNFRSCGNPIRSHLSATSTVASKRSPRHMSINTRGTSSAIPEESPGPAKKVSLRSDSSPSESIRRTDDHNSSTDSMRETYQEKQANYRVDFKKVKDSPPPSKEQWWYPDPFTGHYVPRNHFGEIICTQSVKEMSARKISRNRDGPSSKIDDDVWWTSMEELPDLDR